ncbi:MAG: hypothetical protein J2P36_25785, partial [Ktedonobacteraceae bacterium]|nr:hypothetical protein [Ktedonobacteraceae bacterium]
MKLPLIQQHEGYEIVYLDPSTNILAGKAETAPYVVSLSGGLGSAIAGELANVALGRENIAYWFADVLKEDPDLYRFLHDLMKRWGGRLYWFSSGKRPENIWEQKKLIPNN